MSAEIIQSDGPKNYTKMDLTGFADENNKRLGLRGASGDIVGNTIWLCGGKNFKGEYIDDCIFSSGHTWRTKFSLKTPR